MIPRSLHIKDYFWSYDQKYQKFSYYFLYISAASIANISIWRKWTYRFLRTNSSYNHHHHHHHHHCHLYISPNKTTSALSPPSSSLLSSSPLFKPPVNHYYHHYHHAITCLRMSCSLISFCLSLSGFVITTRRASPPLLSCTATKYTRSVSSCVTVLRDKIQRQITSIKSSCTCRTWCKNYAALSQIDTYG